MTKILSLGLPSILGTHTVSVGRHKRPRNEDGRSLAQLKQEHHPPVSVT